MNDNSIPLALPHVEIYTDGGCEPNPGPGGYGVVLLHPKKRLLSSLSESQLKDLQARDFAGGRISHNGIFR